MPIQCAPCGSNLHSECSQGNELRDAASGTVWYLSCDCQCQIAYPEPEVDEPRDDPPKTRDAWGKFCPRCGAEGEHGPRRYETSHKKTRTCSGWAGAGA